jgi:DNA-binding MarR family transcriptional regulator
MVNRLTNPFADRPPPLGTLLTAAGRRLSAELDAALAEAGFGGVRAAHASVFMTVDPAGSTVTELAERSRMTKQAMGELVRHLAGHGYLEVTEDPDDRRVRRVRLTDRGWQVVDAGIAVIDDFDRWLEESIGGSRVTQLRRTLTRIAETEPAARD